MIPLRQRLRAETRPEHERLDAAFGALRLADRDDYVTFLKAHHAAHRLIEPRIQPAPQRLAALSADLAVLGEAPADGFEDSAVSSANPLGLAYVVAGSYLGGRILRRDWSETANPELHAAGHYFALPQLKPYWHSTLNLLKDADPSQHDNVVAGARSAFRCFERALSFVGS